MNNMIDCTINGKPAKFLDFVGHTRAKTGSIRGVSILFDGRIWFGDIIEYTRKDYTVQPFTIIDRIIRRGENMYVVGIRQSTIEDYRNESR